MGMFDSFYFDRKMPNGFQMKIPDGEAVPHLREIDTAALYQTKCMDCNLDIFTVGEDNRLMRYNAGMWCGKEKNEELEFVDYTGTICIYTGIPQPGEYGYPNKYILSTPDPEEGIPVWRAVEYTLFFDNGILEDIKEWDVGD